MNWGREGILDNSVKKSLQQPSPIFHTYPCLRKPIHSSTAPGHHLLPLILWVGHNPPTNTPSAPRTTGKANSVWQIPCFSIRPYFCMAIAASDPSPPPPTRCWLHKKPLKKKQNYKHHASTGWKDSVMQVLNGNGSAPSPLLSFFPWAPFSCQPQEFVFAGSMSPHYPCLLNSERAAYGAGTASFPMIPHVLMSLIKSGNNCYIVFILMCGNYCPKFVFCISATANWSAYEGLGKQALITPSCPSAEPPSPEQLLNAHILQGD